MEKRSLSTSAAPEITVEVVHGDLLVRSWDKMEVLVRSESEDGLSLVEQEDRIRLSCHGSCSLLVPVAAVIKVGTVHGGARFKALEDTLEIDQVQGTLTLAEVAQVQVGTVLGNLLAKNISGDLRLDRVQGNAILRTVQGDLFVERVYGNLDLRSTGGTIKASVDGNARLRLAGLGQDSYAVDASGNIYCQIPQDASVKVNLTSGGRFIELRTPDQKGSFQQGEYSFTLGDGETMMDLAAGGRIFFGAREMDWAMMEDLGFEFDDEFIGISEEFSQQIARQVEEQIDAQMEALNEQMSRLSETFGRAGLSGDDAERVMKRARESSERAASRAQEKIARAQEKMARKMEAAARKAELKAQAAERRGHPHRGRAWNFQWPSPPAAPVPPPPESEPVSDEERLMILRMLEQKKITLEEAENLLAALEGKGG